MNPLCTSPSDALARHLPSVEIFVRECFTKVNGQECEARSNTIIIRTDLHCLTGFLARGCPDGRVSDLLGAIVHVEGRIESGK